MVDHMTKNNELLKGSILYCTILYRDTICLTQFWQLACVLIVNLVLLHPSIVHFLRESVF